MNNEGSLHVQTMKVLCMCEQGRLSACVNNEASLHVQTMKVLCMCEQ